MSAKPSTCQPFFDTAPAAPKGAQCLDFFPSHCSTVCQPNPPPPRKRRAVSRSITLLTVARCARPNPHPACQPFFDTAPAARARHAVSRLFPSHCGMVCLPNPPPRKRRAASRPVPSHCSTVCQTKTHPGCESFFDTPPAARTRCAVSRLLPFSLRHGVPAKSSTTTQKARRV